MPWDAKKTQIILGPLFFRIYIPHLPENFQSNSKFLVENTSLSLVIDDPNNFSEQFCNDLHRWTDDHASGKWALIQIPLSKSKKSYLIAKIIILITLQLHRYVVNHVGHEILFHKDNRFLLLLFYC